MVNVKKHLLVVFRGFCVFMWGVFSAPFISFLFADHFLTGVTAVESSLVANIDKYQKENACDGDFDSYTVLLDDTPTGNDETRIPPKGDAPVTGFIWFDLGRPCDVYGAEIFAPRNNFYAPKRLDVIYRSLEDHSEKTALTNHQFTYFSNGQSRTIVFECIRTRFIGFRFHEAFDTGRLKYAIIQFGEVRFLGVDMEKNVGKVPTLDLSKVKIGRLSYADALVNQNFVLNRKKLPFPEERLLHDWKMQDGVKEFGSETEKEAYLQKCLARRKERLKNVSGFCREYIFAKHCQLANQPAFASTAFLSDSIYKDRLGDWRMGAELYRLRIDEEGNVQITPILDVPGGIVRDPAVSYDGKMLAFSMRESEADDYHLYTMNLETGETRQITFGEGLADIEPCWLPNGELIFSSTRCDICVPCWSSDVTNLYRCDAQGRYLRRLTFDHAHNVAPSVLNDGRIVYTRWEYNDRNSSPIHKLFMMNADGTSQTEFYGNNSISPWSLIHPAALPGSSKILAIGSGHHTDQAGRLMRIDRTKGTQENEGLEYVSPVEKFTPVNVDLFAHDGKQPLFQHPLGIDEKNWLVSCVPEGSSNPRGFYPTPFGIYWMNEAGERELLVYDPTISSCQIVPVRERAATLERAGNFDLDQDSGYFYVQNVYYGPGLEGVEKGTIRKIRVIGLENRAMSAGVGYQQPGAQVHTPISVGNGSWDVKHVLGTVDVEEDGSAFFKAPPRMGVYFQMLDENGHMVQTMRSWAMVMPGETFGCIGCHEDKRDTFIDSRPITDALKRPPQEIQPLYAEGEIPEPEFLKTLTESERRAMKYLNVNAPQRMDVPQGFSYLRDIQPIWDKHCVSCHYGDEKTPLNLLADTSPYGWKESYDGVALYRSYPGRPYVNNGRDTNTGRAYARSYLELTNWGRTAFSGVAPVHPKANAESKRLLAESVDNQNPSPGQGVTYVNWYPLGRSLPPMIPADFWGARHSKIMKYLEPTHYNVQVSQHEKDLIATWIDLCVPYCGSYMEANTWDRMTHTYVHFYRDKCRPAYLFQEAKRLSHAELEVAHLALWREHLATGKDFPVTDFPKTVVGGMAEQKAFIDAYENLPKTVPVRENTDENGGNLALNPNATNFSLTSYPWVEANSHLGYRHEFAPVNAIDGDSETFWRPNRRTDLELKVHFGREVTVSRAKITLHLTPDQKKTWETAELVFTDGTRVPLKFELTKKPQEFRFDAKKCASVTLTNLKETFPLSENGIAEIEFYAE
ncbi:MAG: hypothetical protein Q4C70_13125 [Planctomycetia bacterium]|nr:hypothetical protein [Planctomycetia bacterium]